MAQLQGKPGGTNGQFPQQLDQQQFNFENQIQNRMQQQLPAPQQQQQMPMQQNMEDDSDMIGVLKIKDGLFICDELGAQDLEFVVANKVTRVVNCAGTQMPNHWEPVGILYLTLNWQDDEKQTLFDSQERIPDEIYRFMETAIANHESVLVQSQKAMNRACFVIASFVMRRYRWSLLKTLEFLNSRRPDLEMRQSFLSQLSLFENRLVQRGLGPKTSKWTELSENSFHLENEELILRNTFLNSQQAPLADLSKVNLAIAKNFTLKWVDLAEKGKSLTEENRDEDDLVNLKNPAPIQSHRQMHRLKSGIKGKGIFIANQEATSQMQVQVQQRSQSLSNRQENSSARNQNSEKKQQRSSSNFDQKQRMEQQKLQQQQQQNFNFMLQNQQASRDMFYKEQRQIDPSENKQLRGSFQQQNHDSFTKENTENRTDKKENQKDANPLYKSFDGKVKQAFQDQSNTMFANQNNKQEPKKIELSQKIPQKIGQPMQQSKPRRFSPKPSQKPTQQMQNIQRVSYSRQNQQMASNSYSSHENSGSVKRSQANQPRYGSLQKRPSTPNQAPQQNALQNQQQQQPQRTANMGGNAMRYTASGADTSMHLKGGHNENQKNMLYSFRNGPIRVTNANCQIGQKTNGINKPQPSLSKGNSVERKPHLQQNTRPSSAPQKKQSSANFDSFTKQPSVQQQQKNLQNSQSAISRMNVMKYSHGKQVNQNMGVVNPTLRGYSPSKPRWKS